MDHELNNYLSTVKASVLKVHHLLEMRGRIISANMIKDQFLNNDVEHKSLLEVFRKHNDECRQLVGKGYAKATADKFDLINYLKFEYNRKDILLSELTVEFIRGFEFYLKTKGNIRQHNSALKHMKALRKIVKRTLDYGWLKIDPFVSVNLNPAKTDIFFLKK